MFRKQFWGVAN